ncbi:MAG: outer membrane lipoprotein-sorting protein, partial [Bdellovibrionota bacterium]
MIYRTVALFGLVLLSVSALTSAADLTAEQTAALVRKLDEKQRNSGDYQSLAYMRETEKGKEPRLYQIAVYRRDEDNKFMILFTKPKEEAGKGYLKIDKNLWMFDPNTGRWERRTERERIGGTNSRRG